MGAGTSALALHALAEVLERARSERLTRDQHVLFRLGELIAWAEGSRAMSRRAASATQDGLSEKAFRRFDAPALAAISRVFAREAALKVGTDGLRWVCGAQGTDVREFETKLNLSAIHAAQAGLPADMDQVADVVYDRR